MNLTGRNAKVGAAKLGELSYRISDHDVLYVPLELPEGADEDYWEEDYDFSKEIPNSIVIKVIDTKRVSIVYDESYDGDKHYYLVDIDGVLHILNDDHSSWGDSEPVLKEVVGETKTVYTLGDVHFVR